MNLNALKQAAENLKTGGGGAEGFFSTKVLTEEGVPIRLLPEPAQLDGIFYFPVVKYWMTVNGKRCTIICCSTFKDAEGKAQKSVIQEVLDEARDSDDEGVIELLDDKENGTCIKRDQEFWMAALQLEYKMKGDEIVGAKVVDNRSKIFQCGKETLLREMVKVATSGKAVRMFGGDKTPDGVADRVKGINLLCSKTGKAKMARYVCTLDEQMEMDEKYYVNIPNVYEVAKAQMPLKSYQRAAVRNHLYGESIPDDVQKKEDARREKVKELFKAQEDAAKAAAPVAKKKAAAVVLNDDDEEVVVTKPKKKAIVQDDEDEDEAPKAVAKKKVPPPPPAKSKKPVADPDEDDEPAEDLDDSDELEDDDEPAPVAKKSVKKPAVDDDDEDEDPLPAKPVVKKKAATALPIDEDEEDLVPVVKKKAAAPTKKAAPAKRNILDMLDEDDE